MINTSPDLVSQISQAKQILNNVGEIGRYKLAKEMGITTNRARKILDSIKAVDGWKANKPVAIETKGSLKDSSEVIGDKWNLGIPSTRIHTLEQLIEYFEVDTKIWTTEKFTCNKWEVGAVDDSGKLVVEPLYQVKATFAKAKGLTIDAVKEEIRLLKEDAKKGIKLPPVSRVKKSSGNSLELSIYDAHFGRQSWGEETLWENYDLKIAQLDYDKAVDVMLSRCSVELDEICYVVGNDLMHFDNFQSTTTKGTPVDVDGRYPKVFTRIRQTVQRQIEKLRKIAPVKVYFVPGNHDTLSTWHLGDSIECFYHNCKDVSVFNEPSKKKYYKYGKNLLMFTHGDKGKKENYPLVMAKERPEWWADSRYHEIHVGHLHKLETTEIVGCRVRIIPALCPPDAWHAENFYVGNVRGAQSFIWNKEDGLTGTIEYAI